MKFVKNSALSNYLKPLLNLGVFVTQDDLDTEDDERNRSTGER